MANVIYATHAIALIRSPDDSKVKQKMLFASSKEALRRALVGVASEVQGTDFSEIAYESGALRVPSVSVPQTLTASRFSGSTPLSLPRVVTSCAMLAGCVAICTLNLTSNAVPSPRTQCSRRSREAVTERLVFATTPAHAHDTNAQVQDTACPLFIEDSETGLMMMMPRRLVVI